MSSPPEPTSRLLRELDAWNRRAPPLGALTLAALGVAFLTGAALATGYDVRAPLEALGQLQLSSLPGRWLRALHAWSSHLSLLLVAVHVVEHLLRRSDRKLRTAPWVRVVLLLPVLLGVALTGFLLRGDAEGRLARQVLGGLLELGGPALAAAVLGVGDDLQLVYVLHAATLPVVLALVSVEHGRRVWPGAGSILGVTAACSGLGLAFPPGLHDGINPVVKGPWYFVAVQEVLHWLPQPAWVLLVFLVPVAGLGVVPRLQDPWRRRVLRAGMVLAVVYALLGAWAQFFRGEGWDLVLPWQRAPLASTVDSSSWLTAAVVPAQTVLARPEGCLACHGHVQGLGPSHDPSAVGCASCHLGNPFAADARGAHAGMLRVPGNLDAAALTCGQPSCHGGVVQRVQHSLMASVHGMIGVDRFAFGESAVPDTADTPKNLGHNPADRHLQQLCVRCHLGTPKQEPGPVTELSRGGGCTACHLQEEPRRTPVGDQPDAFMHPGITVKVGDEHCFGCHSRSGRISLNYAGWAEGDGDGPTRNLQDGRVVRRMPEDGHHTRGMACIDCHGAVELMGDGHAWTHQELATRVRCTTCHRVQAARAQPLVNTDAETQAIVRLREGSTPGRRVLLEDRTGEALTNAIPLPDGTVEVRGKVDGKRRIAVPPARSCTAIKGHERLSCQACHSAWAPRCVGCHTQASRDGWVEFDVPADRAPPALGMLSRHGKAEIEPVVPGMVMTLNTAPVAEMPVSATLLTGPGTRFFRAYAPAAPHTTTKAGRSCRSCHLEPEALGWGRGTLKLVEQDGKTAWSFAPAYESARFDNLPADAWIAFTAGSNRSAATRNYLVPLDEARRLRTLDAGACMTCHAPEEPRNQALYEDFQRQRAHRSPRCRVP